MIPYEQSNWIFRHNRTSLFSLGTDLVNLVLLIRCVQACSGFFLPYDPSFKIVQVLFFENPCSPLICVVHAKFRQCSEIKSWQFIVKHGYKFEFLEIALFSSSAPSVTPPTQFPHPLLSLLIFFFNFIACFSSCLSLGYAFSANLSVPPFLSVSAPLSWSSVFGVCFHPPPLYLLFFTEFSGNSTPSLCSPSKSLRYKWPSCN